ncbi:hypothetical protein LOZ12_002781 [Ophidiomyces ophidiicola]|uniref:Uncharacterized protein n=1 Tax=Ophidiomyces ophidiicola TaxID=1387563 RepID=A0ACB8V450_9EURO|nr:uncharacterized protein LOZ57_005250 [Ophidiomyces ophidiicola]KAI1912865.1 hypothetical protein LOZ61_003069 [Ophidiomyces ophidiicola]KAI1930736.1 hypothetical protein LOZ60_000712 [Ophidiomyces ophidiicola]KAI1942953.1 hypothetical protein LOZ57_005250 [Ophidiomyces ophidiicola]KAI1952055.1 hypothetical protein LOZ62_001584 [Ophidiomyces ophidiicola]KAI1962253.1 hypothetical protein LOZ59_002083 [Ophidiomyces ophidiicola]
MDVPQSIITYFRWQDSNTLFLPSLIGPLVLAYCLFQWTRLRAPKLDLPVVGDPTASDFRSALEEGAKKVLYPNSPFVLPTPMHPTVILPHSAIDAIKNLPEEVISLRQHHYTIFVGAYTHFGNKADELDAAIRIDLTRNVEKILQIFQGEIDYAFEQNIGECKTWTAIPGYEKMLRIVSLLSSRVFVGLPLSRNEEWIQTTCKYALDGGAGAHALTPYPTFLRPFVAPFLLRSLKQHRALAREMMQPLADKYATANRSEVSADDNITGGDLIQYIVSRYNGPVTAERLARDQLIATFVAMHTTTICLTQVLFDLAARPEYVQPLREELEEALKADSHQDGLLHNTTMIRLRKMDSFIRESQRTNPPGLVTMLRHVTSPDGLRLASGHVIPKGTVVGISNHMVTRSYPEPDTFDGFRFSKLREQPGHEIRHQLATTGPDALSFGHGNHACPGRFFAANEIKVVIAHLIQNFDIKLKDGESRPENHHRGAIVSPSANGEVLLRSRTSAL